MSEPAWLKHLQESWPILSGIVLVGWSLWSWLSMRLKTLAHVESTIPPSVLRREDRLLTSREVEEALARYTAKQAAEHAELMESIRALHKRLDDHLENLRGL